ncbi:MAG: tetratricopeptide repeat protein, partial [Betaproteobacteria bacterium]
IAWRAEGALAEASLAIAENRATEAVDALRAGMAVDPFASALYLNLADLHRSEGNEPAALAALNEGLARLPDDGYLLYSRGLAAFRSQQQAEALAFFEQAVAVQPDNIDFVVANVLLLEALGQFDSALSVLDAPFKSQPMPPQLGALRQRLLSQKRTTSPLNH